MEDKSLHNNQQSKVISDGLQNYIDSMIEEIMLGGNPFNTQRKYLKIFSEREGVNYIKLEADIATFIDILESIKDKDTNNEFYRKVCCGESQRLLHLRGKDKMPDITFITYQMERGTFF